MLRRGLSERSPSVCMFCQHRLSRQQSRLPQWRSLSSTASRANWGKPLFANTPPQSNTTAPAPASTAAGAGNSPTGKPVDASASALLPHEIEARQRMAAARAEAKQVEDERAAAAAPKPGQGFRHTWNPQRQEKINDFVKTEAAAMPRPVNHPSPFAHKSKSAFPNDRKHSTPFPHDRKHSTPFSQDKKHSTPFSQDRKHPTPFSQDRKHPTPFSQDRKHPTPFSQIRKTTARDTPKKQETGLSGDGWGPSSFSGQKTTEPSRNTAPRPAPTSSTSSPQNASSTASGSWNSLTRRQQPGSAGQSDFWSMAEKAGPQKPSRTGPLDDWGKDFDKPKQRQPSESRPFDRQRSRPPTRNAEQPPSQTFERQPRVRDQPQVDEIREPAPAAPTSQAHGDRKPRRQDSKRNDKFEIDRGQDRKPAAKKRGGRSSRFEEEEDDDYDDYEEYTDQRKLRKERKAKREAERAGPIPIVLPELISISNLAAALKIEKGLFLDQLAELGFEGVALDSVMAGETAALVAQEYGFEPTVESGEEKDLKPRPPPEDVSVLPPRPPVVTIMGHVDHGKTTLLDFLRKSSVAAGEHGGITQHIGAFSVSMSSGKQITFLDTPGHAAFLSMRQRGANVTDIVVLVVAADDSVKPQTREAIKHAKGSNVPIIVAINKIDKDGAQIDRVKADLASHGVEIEDFGGDVQVVCVSGKTGQGMDDLEENILTLSEILDMRAEIDGPGEGWILESSLKPIGKVATILVKRGTLRPGDFIVAGTTYAKIRHLRNEAGQEIREAPPGTPVEILGWRDLPAAGDQVIQGADERQVRSAAKYREDLRAREQDAAAQVQISEQRKQLSEQRREEKAAEKGKYKRPDGNWGTQEVAPLDEVDGAKMVNFMIKGDVHGSVEAVCLAIQEIGSNEVRPRLLTSAPGAITESDVEQAATSNAVLVNFNLPISGLIKRQAEKAGVKILDHNVIYHLTDDVRKHMSGFLGVDLSYKVVGEAEVLQIFPINIKGREYKNIAGCRIRNGQVGRNHLFRVMRGGEKIYEGKLESLKHVKKDIDEARKGTECGIGFELFQDMEVGDQIQAVEEISTQRML